MAGSTLLTLVNTELAAHAIAVADEFNTRQGPWAAITHAGVRHYLVKGWQGAVRNIAATLETGDKLFGDNGVQVIFYTCLDAGHVDIDDLTSAAWDSNAID